MYYGGRNGIAFFLNSWKFDAKHEIHAKNYHYIPLNFLKVSALIIRFPLFEKKKWLKIKISVDIISDNFILPHIFFLISKIHDL